MLSETKELLSIVSKQKGGHIPAWLAKAHKSKFEVNIKLLGKALTAAGLVALTGCAALDQIAQDMQEVTAPVMITEALPRICQVAKDNKVRANELYVNKGLSASGEVRSVTEGFQPRYRVFMKAGDVAIHAGTEKSQQVTHLRTGKVARVSGVVTDVTYDYQGCSIALKDATF
ncbi:hypothetical protein GAW19_21955 [Salmonella enterica subsp. enterica serovar Enteritidis]|nr:hypothetical protein [Salmonella enterica subsp. enterica serovar Enteritidis]